MTEASASVGLLLATALDIEWDASENAVNQLLIAERPIIW